MKVLLDTFKQAQSKSNIWLVPDFEGKVAAAAREFGFDRNEAISWGFEGKTGQSQVVLHPKGRQKILLLGAGKQKEFSAETARQLVARSIRHSATQKVKSATGLFVASALAGHKLANQLYAEACAEGALLGSYAFTQLKGKGTEKSDMPTSPQRFIVAFARVRKLDRDRFRDGLIMAKWANWGRDLLNRSQSHVSASVLASRVRTAASGMKKVRCTVMGKKQIEALKMRLLLAVNQGSTEPPKFIVLQYNGGKTGEKPVCLIGKGLTFDTGRYNLKPGESMRGMHMDKGGGVGALASFFASAEMKLKKNLVCLVPTTDSRVSGSAMVPGDVYVGLNGISVEVDNTDAEGRLILADALAYSKKYKPSCIIDMATLTGAAVVALGDQASAILTNDDRLSAQLLEQAKLAGELVWRLPLWKEYNSKIKSTTADIKNAGGRWGGAITAALFLQHFVPDGTKWCHIDMAGKMKAESDRDYAPAGCAYGFGPQLIARWLRSTS